MNGRSLLIVSLGLNLLLAGVVAWAAKSRAAAAVPPRIPESITNRIVRTRPFTNPSGPAVIQVAAPFNWAQVESTDYRVYIANLRAIGCPEATIRDIVEADVNNLFAERVRRLNDAVTGYFWNVMTDREKMRVLVEDRFRELDSLDDQRQQVMEELFEADERQLKAAREEHRAEQIEIFKRQLDFLTDEKINRIEDARERFGDAWDEFKRQNPNASRDQQDRKNQELLGQVDRDVQASLTPEEYEEYTLRMDGGVHYTIGGLADLDVTEDEVRAIAVAKMKSQDDDAIRRILGPERFADYQRVTDSAYQQTLRVTDRFDLPAETAVQVCQMQKEAEAQARVIRNDRNRSVEERRQILQAMQAETEQAIGSALGPKVFRAYQKYSGAWLTKFAEIPANP